MRSHKASPLTCKLWMNICVAACVYAAVTVSSARAGDWAVDATTTCRVWNPHPQLNETVKWTGACANGFAQGTGSARWIRGNITFETDDGEWRDGYQVGNGTQVWPSGSYAGDLVNSEPHGRGTFVLQSSRYEGEFRNGKPNGTGKLTGPSGVAEGQWVDGCLRSNSNKVAFGMPLSECR
jgi:MORN repeat